MRSTRLLGFLVAVALAAVAGIGSAQAATPSAGPAAPHAHHIPRGAVSLPVKDLRHFSHLLHSKRPATGGTTANQTSTNWAGYAANGGTFTTVTSSWTEPDVSCNSNGIVAFWIGLDGWAAARSSRTAPAWTAPAAPRSSSPGGRPTPRTVSRSTATPFPPATRSPRP